MAPPQTEVVDIYLQPTTHLSIPKGWKTESAWLADLQRTVYPHKSLNGSTPRYLSDDCQLVSDVGRRRLRSSDISTCVVPCTHTGFGDRAFQVAGPRRWNSLPASVSLRQSNTTVGQFEKLLKTHLFSWDCGALVTVAFAAPCINISTTIGGHLSAVGRAQDRESSLVKDQRSTTVPRNHCIR